MDFSFVSLDERLRPRRAAVPFQPAAGPPEIPVNPQTFPELASRFDQMQRDAGISGYHLVILGNFGSAGSDWDRKLVGIGDRVLNLESFDDVVEDIAHEVAHLFRHHYPQGSIPGAPVRGLNRERQEEVNADRLGACLTGDAYAMASSLRHSGVTMDEGLPIELRVQAVTRFNMEDCPIGPRRRP